MGLLDDIQHWRSFALSYDKKAYHEYLRSEPFKGFSPQTIESTPLSRGEVGDEDDDVTVRAGHQPPLRRPADDDRTTRSPEIIGPL